MAAINELDLRLPRLPTHQEWERAVTEAEGPLAKKALAVRARGYSLLAGVEEAKASAERLGWLNLWTKAMWALEGAACAHEGRSAWLLKCIERSTFEWRLHSQVIVQPVDTGLEREVVERLRAYAAWCFWSDRDYYSRCLTSGNLREIWDPAPAQHILGSSTTRSVHEALFGPLEVETDAMELAAGRAEMELLYGNTIGQITEWLAAPPLRKWADLLTQKYQEMERPANFYELFERGATTSKELRRLGMRFAYLLFAKGSMAIHGSSMDEFIRIDDGSVYAGLEAEDGRLAVDYEGLVDDCNALIVLLAAMHKIIVTASGDGT